MNRTGIEWTHIFGPGSGFTWNPVVGCTHGCSYCYARGQARRQKGKCQLCYDYVPHLHEERLEQPVRRKKPAGIFLGSMCDLWDPNVPQAWRDRIWEVVEACPQHVFWALTQRAEEASHAADFDRWWGRDGKGRFPPNLWFGATITGDWQVDRLYNWTWFASFEPLHGPIEIQKGFGGTVTDPPEPDWDPLISIGWAIVGAETGNRKGKVVPEADWVTDIVDRAEELDTAVFLKPNLAPIVGEAYVKQHQHWPEAMKS